MYFLKQVMLFGFALSFFNEMPPHMNVSQKAFCEF